MARRIVRAESICGLIIASVVGMMAYQTFPDGSLFFVIFVALLAFVLTWASVATLRELASKDGEGNEHTIQNH